MSGSSFNAASLAADMHEQVTSAAAVAQQLFHKFNEEPRDTILVLSAIGAAGYKLVPTGDTDTCLLAGMALMTGSDIEYAAEITCQLADEEGLPDEHPEDDGLDAGLRRILSFPPPDNP